MTMSELEHNTHKGWRSRGYLPHFDAPGLVQSITFRLADSVPVALWEALEQERNQTNSLERRRQIEDLLNNGYGACYLARPEIGRLVEDALRHFDGERYRLIAWVIMPNHVHVLAEIWLGQPLDKIVHAWKSFTANEANRLLGREGRFWAREYYDRYIRNERHLAAVTHYIEQNPVKAGLVQTADAWPFSSARLRAEQQDE